MFEKMIGAIKADTSQSTKTVERIDSIIQESLIDFRDEFDRDFWECYKIDDKPEAIECCSRDGFIPYSDNRGGYTLAGFFFNYYNASEFTGNTQAQDELQKISDYNFECGVEQFLDDNPTLKNLDVELINYHDLYEMKLGSLAEELDEYCHDDQESYMVTYEVRYQGFENGYHYFLIQSAFNWEYPYHRSSMPAWAGGGSNEVWSSETIETKSVSTLKKQVMAKLRKVHKGITQDTKRQAA